jgi:phosphoserine phosphatase
MYRDMKTSKSIVSDIDETLIGSRMAESGLDLVSSEWSEGNYGTALRGFFGGVRILVGTSIRKQVYGNFEAENWGLQTYHQILGKNRIPKVKINSILRSYVEKHQMPGVKEFLGGLRTFGLDKGLFLTTTGPSNGAEVCAEFFGAVDYVYSGEFISGIEMLLRNPEERRELTEQMLRKHGTSLGDSIVIGDKDSDWPLLDNAKVSIASPKADRETIRRADIHITDYRQFALQIK